MSSVNHVNEISRKEKLGDENNQRHLYSRLRMTLKMLSFICQEKLAMLSDIQHLQEHIAYIQSILNNETTLTTERLENLLEHCKFYIKKYL